MAHLSSLTATQFRGFKGLFRLYELRPLRVEPEELKDGHSFLHTPSVWVFRCNYLFFRQPEIHIFVSPSLASTFDGRFVAHSH